jgi:histidinol-phosphatase (PHP family)
VLTSYHNHTSWSDGANSVAEMARAAHKAGLDELGISDHYVLHPGGVVIEWTMPLDRLPDYVAELQAAASASELPIRVGVEADYFPETIDDLRGRLAALPFDYVIGSVHFLDGFPVDKHARYWDGLNAEERDEKWRLYWRRIIEMAQSGVFDFAAHLDLPKKFGHRPSPELRPEEDAALDAISAAGMAIEINTAGWAMPARECYPSTSILMRARERDIPLLINADAHRRERLGYRFQDARILAIAMGYDQVVRYEQRRGIPVSLQVS